MGLIKSYRKKHWVVALDADLASIPSPLIGDTALTEDKGKLYYKTAAGWKTGLGYEYVPRSPALVDKAVGDFTTDGTWKVNGLDLSGIVPAGAVAVELRAEITDGAANTLFQIRQNDVAIEAKLKVTTQVANLERNQYAKIPIDSDRLYDYFGANLVFTAINVTVLGWYI